MHDRCPWTNLARNSDGSLTRRLSNVGTSDSPPSLRLSFFCFLLSFSFLLGLDFFQPDRPVAVASSRIASLPAERGQAAQAQTGPLPSSPPSLRLSVIPAEPLLLACLVAARPQLQLAILGPDPHSAVSPPACSAPGLRIIQPPIQWWARPSVWVTGSYFKISSRALSLQSRTSPLGTDPPPLLSSHSHYPSSALCADAALHLVSRTWADRSHTPVIRERTDPARLRFRAGIHWPPCHRRRRSIDSAALSHDQTPSCVLHESQKPIGLRPL
ncbi:hypothetical protein T069G_02592 [Trichoderma breve]|uniref:Uncharacterized protein n=1 Tax=Trichoderma breve TaxID=2034170 RepID=A0A9W9BE52_9HYPO|nr:hypothetical protein T069G_02592 [Trichoderma breve]KAJ4861638.1 hypothetical protein T069G_02592 [Trichoderma breve]